jgi:long-chain acyl-CoA synthetase
MTMHPSQVARITPDKPALIMAIGGETTTYAELEARSNQSAHLFRQLNMQRGAMIAVLLENHPAFLEIAWAAQRSGLYLVCISSRLKTDEAEFILRDSGAQLMIASSAMRETAEALMDRLPAGVVPFMLTPPSPGFRDFLAERAAMPETPIADESHGGDMLYSSGTTGRPKGVLAPLPDGPIDTPPPIEPLARQRFGFDADTVYLCPAPLYHAAPLRWSMLVQRLGGTVILMERYDSNLALELIERYRVTAGQFVPTHFVRMLKLPEEERFRWDVSSLRVAVHAAAPCPVPVKRQMIEWWGPILWEYYAGTESNGLTALDSADWLRKPGSVGRSMVGQARICDEAGNPLPQGSEGLVYFAEGLPFEYHNDPAKTAESRNAMGWTTLGDIGRLDEEGYLFLTDRRSFTIISGGVNIYPQEIENLLITHPCVADVAVIGAPDEEMGEKVVAVVQPLDWAAAGPDFAHELDDFARRHLSGIKIPRQIDFMRELPRHPTGKLYKRLVRDEYWAGVSR